MKTLLLDIETSPNCGFFWSLYKITIPITAIKESSSVLCFSAKWYEDGDSKAKIIFDSVKKSGKRRMLQHIHRLLSEAEAVIHYNGSTFDCPVLNKEFVIAGMPPPSPYKEIDVLKTVRSRFRFTSSKLDYVSQALGLGRKVEHTGFQLWLDCLNGDEKAWKLLERYNKNDVTLLENVYKRILPWVKNHPNRALYNGVEACPRCGSKSFQSRGTSVAITATYRRFQCQDCFGWFRGEKVKTAKARFQGIH